MRQMAQKPRPSLRIVAAQAGCTTTTVWLALRNDPRVTPETRQRVQRIARELGYTPDALQSTMMAQVRARKSPQQRITLAFLTAFPQRDEWRKASLYRDYFAGAAERAHQLGYQLEEFWAKEPGMTGRRLTEILVTRNIRGLLICSLPRPYGHLSLDWSQFAAATFGYSLRRPELHRTSYDHFRGTTTVLHQVKRLGYRRVGLVQAGDTERINEAYRAAVAGDQLRVPVRQRVPPLVADTLSDEAIKAWFIRHQPDLVLSPGPSAMRCIRACGRSIPRDVGYVFLQWESRNAPCAGIENNPKLVGAEAVNLVVRQLQNNEFGIPAHPVVVLVEGTWHDGATIRPQR